MRMNEQMNPQQPQAPISPVPVAGNTDIEQNRDMAALSYAWILSVFVYVSRKDSAFVRFHSKQAMVLFAFSVLFWLVPVVGRFLELIVLGYCVVGFLAAVQGQWKELVIIGQIARGDWRAALTAFLGLFRQLLHFVPRRKKPIQILNPNPSPNPPPTHSL